MTETLNPATTEAGLTLGQQLKQAREAQNLTIADVVTKTNLKKAHIEAIEDDIFILPNIPPAFIRGYVRNYVRFLHLPESLVNSVNYGEVTIPKEVQKAAASTIKPSHPKSQNRILKFGTAIVLLGAVGMTLAWWWQNYQKEQQDRDQVVNAVTQDENAFPLPNRTENAPLALPATTTEPAAPAQNETAAPVTAATEPQTIAANNTVNDVTAPVVNNVDNPPVLNIETPASATVNAPEQENVAPVNVLQQNNAETANADNAEIAATEQPAAMGDADLRIEITGNQSWITVRGEKNKRLAEKLYTNGEVLSFKDNAQYRLTIGAPANVKVYYKGQVVPLKVDGRVARFKLPQ